ncbi:hypothetical protein BC830DRAFT_321622 [Chytriomyces sp. MP71]|nr:hypothetical protein BC830DRAFT_321622 [Chytriomyces sp. MP71]
MPDFEIVRIERDEPSATATRTPGTTIVQEALIEKVDASDDKVIDDKVIGDAGASAEASFICAAESTIRVSSTKLESSRKMDASKVESLNIPTSIQAISEINSSVESPIKDPLCDDAPRLVDVVVDPLQMEVDVEAVFDRDSLPRVAAASNVRHTEKIFNTDDIPFASKALVVERERVVSKNRKSILALFSSLSSPRESETTNTATEVESRISSVSDLVPAKIVELKEPHIRAAEAFTTRTRNSQLELASTTGPHITKLETLDDAITDNVCLLSGIISTTDGITEVSSAAGMSIPIDDSKIQCGLENPKFSSAAPSRLTRAAVLDDSETEPLNRSIAFLKDSTPVLGPKITTEPQQESAHGHTVSDTSVTITTQTITRTIARFTYSSLHAHAIVRVQCRLRGWSDIAAMLETETAQYVARMALPEFARGGDRVFYRFTVDGVNGEEMAYVVPSAVGHVESSLVEVRVPRGLNHVAVQASADDIEAIVSQNNPTVFDSVASAAVEDGTEAVSIAAARLAAKSTTTFATSEFAQPGQAVDHRNVVEEVVTDNPKSTPEIPVLEVVAAESQDVQTLKTLNIMTPARAEGSLSANRGIHDPSLDDVLTGIIKNAKVEQPTKATSMVASIDTLISDSVESTVGAEASTGKSAFAASDTPNIVAAPGKASFFTTWFGKKGTGSNHINNIVKSTSTTTTTVTTVATVTSSGKVMTTTDVVMTSRPLVETLLDLFRVLFLLVFILYVLYQVMGTVLMPVLEFFYGFHPMWIGNVLMPAAFFFALYALLIS